MFISPAFAQAGGGFGGGDLFSTMGPLILIFAVFYFLLIRPQQKKAREHKEMLGRVKRGDRVITGGGITGTVTKVLNDNEVAVEIADGVKVRVQRSLISTVLARTEPVKEGASKPEAAASVGGVGSVLKGLLGGKSK